MLPIINEQEVNICQEKTEQAPMERGSAEEEWAHAGMKRPGRRRQMSRAQVCRALKTIRPALRRRLITGSAEAASLEDAARATAEAGARINPIKDGNACASQ